MNKFVFIAPMFNASSTLERMLHSLYGQSHVDWQLILIDDVSSEEHVEKSIKIINKFMQLDDKKITTFWNTEKMWEVANVLYGIKQCDDDAIICRIDADDWLVDLDALAIIDAAYEQTGCDVLWTAHRWGFSDRNISGNLPDHVDPYKHPWVTSHLKTFRKRLLNDVPYENFLNMNGELVKRAGDQCIYLPVLNNAKKRIFLPRVMYHYTIDEQGGAVYQTDDAKFQKTEADYLRHRGYVSNGPTWQEKITW